MSAVQAFRLRLSGRVQGVGFRWFTRQAARELGLTGRVRNLPDGCVEIEVAGGSEPLAVFRERVRQGPQGARVTGLEEQEISPVPTWDGFVIDRQERPWTT
ncbi:MAG TPA: acylphosphatase [Thermoanaerobaculia bacterium]|nr:acylphosphatase [Thermoanaerobaculia bacterium]